MPTSKLPSPSLHMRDHAALTAERTQTSPSPVLEKLWRAAGIMVLLCVGAVAWFWSKGYALEHILLKVYSYAEPIHLPPQMVTISAGTLQQGDAERLGGPWRQPVHTVNVKTFAIAAHEVTFDEYDRFAVATNHRLPHDHGWGRGQRPVIDVSWEDAAAYAAWLAKETGTPYRLPTESEWEYAARSGIRQELWSGTSDHAELPRYAVSIHSGAPHTNDVGSLHPNASGLHDMSGNVWEWVQDCYHMNYANAPTDGSAWLQSAEADCSRRMIRGGSWNDDAPLLQTSMRGRSESTARSNGVGFRLARDVQ